MTHEAVGVSTGRNIDSHQDQVSKFPGQIIWPDSNSIQFNVQATNLLFDSDMSRVTPWVVNKSSKLPSSLLTSRRALPIGPKSVDPCNQEYSGGSMIQ